MQVQIIGLGYIGLPTAAVMGSLKISVRGVDLQEEVVSAVNRGEVHVLEPGLEALVSASVSDGSLCASSIVDEADVHLVVVPTPFKCNHEPDISFVEQATSQLIPILREGDTFIIESTSPIGTTERMARLIFRERPELRDKIYVAYCPERVLPGYVLHELVHNDRVIGGINSESTQKACEFYKSFVRGELHQTNSRTAEMCKLIENSSRDVQIAFANELSIICDRADINVWELIALANKHPRVNILNPGAGVGGHCIAVDPYFIVSDYPQESRIIRNSREVNDYKAFWCAEKIRNSMLEFEMHNGRKAVVALMGLAFKPDIDDLRESPAEFIAQKVMQAEMGDILVVEPNIDKHDMYNLTDYRDAYCQSDIVAFLVGHKEFIKLEHKDGKEILDFVGVLEG